MIDNTILKRFWMKVDKSCKCWHWTASTNKGGYGTFRLRESSFLAHRLSWIIKYGEIPNGLYVLHKCDNPPCVNPDHLFLGTFMDNMNDKVNKNRQSCGERTNRKCLTENIVIYIRRKANSGHTIPCIARELGINKRTVDLAATGETWKHINEPIVQPRYTKLTDDQVLEIRRMFESGEKKINISRKFNAHKDTIGRICSRKTRNSLG